MENSEKKEIQQLDTSWFDDDRRKWTCRIDVPTAYRFCKEYDFALYSVSKKSFHPDFMSASELFDIAYFGTRWNANARANDSMESFLASHRDPKTYCAAMMAGRRAVINFTESMKTERNPVFMEVLRESEECITRMVTREDLDGIKSFLTSFIAKAEEWKASME